MLQEPAALWFITNVFSVVKIYATNAKGSVCGKCTVILSWVSGMNYLAAVNRISELIKTNRLNSKLSNENYCKANFGTHATQVIMDAVGSSKRK